MSSLNYSLSQANQRLGDLIASNTASVTNLIDLLGNVTGKVAGAGASDTFFLQSGVLADRAHASDATSTLINTSPGTHLKVRQLARIESINRFFVLKIDIWSN